VAIRYQLAVRGASLVTPAGLIRADLGVTDGIISAIVAPGSELEASQVIEAAGRHVLPGAVDVHTHHREPGFTHKEDIVSATTACAAGGVTTTFAMPNVDPPPNTVDRLREMLELYAKKAIVDYNVNAAATLPDEFAGLADLGIAAFKVFMVADTGRSYPHMPGIGVHDHGELLRIFEAVRETGLPLMVHPHDQQLMTKIEHDFWDRGERDAQSYAVAVLLRLQRATGTWLHLLHTQTRDVLKQIREAKRSGQQISAETNTWTLFLGNDWSNIERLGSYALGYWVPEENTEPLWAALTDGTIDIFSTDHAPHLREEKEPGWTDGWKAHTGTPSVQFYVPLLLNEVNRGRISLERVVEVIATRPADVFGLPTKGRIAVGADADLAIVDLDDEWEIHDEQVLSKCGWTPYAGRRVRGRVTETIVRGRVVFENGNVVGKPGWGRQTRPAGRAAAATPGAPAATARGNAL
jgi:dihydroorotase